MINAIQYLNNNPDEGPWPPNPEVAYPLDPLAIERGKAVIKADVESRRLIEEEQSRIRLEERRCEIRLKQAAEVERIKEQSKYAQLTILEDSKGEFYLERRYTDKKSDVTRDILNVKHLRITVIKAVELLDTMELISYEGCTHRILLVGDQCNEDGFRKALKRAGIAVQVSKSLTPKVIELLYGHLKTRAEEKLVHAHFGWNKEPDGWFFAENPEEIFEELKNGDA